MGELSNKPLPLAEPKGLAHALGPHQEVPPVCQDQWHQVPGAGIPVKPWNKVYPVPKGDKLEKPPPKFLSHSWSNETGNADSSAEQCSRPSKAIRSDTPQSRPLALELCAGHAGYTASLWDHGFEAIGVDWTQNGHDAIIPVMSVDLSSQEGQELVCGLSHKDA